MHIQNEDLLLTEVLESQMLEVDMIRLFSYYVCL